MAENELQKLINGIFSRIKEKYGYTDEQALIFLKGYEDCAKDNQEALEKRDKMLRDTVAELCEAKRLLIAAVKDITNVKCNNDTYAPGGCEICVNNNNCDYSDSFKWVHEAEALALIGKDIDVPAREDGERND